MTIGRWLKNTWDGSFLKAYVLLVVSEFKAYLTLEHSDASSLKVRLKRAWLTSILSSFTIGLTLLLLSGNLVLCSLASLALYFVFMHLLVASRIKEINEYIVSEEHPIDFEKYTHVTNYRQSSDRDLDKYLARYFQARQFSMYVLMASAFCSILMLILLLVVIAGL